MVRFGKAFLFALMIAMVPLGAAVTVSVSPTTASVKQKATQTFTATVTGSTNTAVTWTVTAGGGSITTAGVYTAPTVAGTYTVTATSKADTAAKATATVTVPDVAISLSPTTATVAQAGTQQFTATVTGTTTTTVTWTASGGTVSTSGKFTAPSTAGTYTVTATSTANTAKTATATVTVPVKVVLSPATGSMSQLATKQYTATVTGSANTAVTWSCSAGSINSSGLYTAPAAAGTYTITATSVGTPQGSGTASITVNPVAISISPTTATVNQGATKTFTATVTGSTNTAVNWAVTGGGSVTSGGVYTPPASAATATVTAKSVTDPSKTAAAVVTVPDIVVTLNQTTATVAQGGTNQFTATVTGTATAGVNWSVIPSTGAGTINTSGLYTAPLAAGTYTVRATSKATATRWAEAVVTVPAITVQVNPSTTTIIPAATQQYTATVTGAANTGVTWFVNPGEGTITTGGLYTAPLEPGAYTITAFSKAVPAKSGTATVTVLPVVTVQVSPATVTMEVFNTKAFLPQVTGDSNKAVTWSVVGGAANGWITPSGIYHAPARPGTFTVVATSVADPSKSGSATVVVQGNSGVWCSVSPDEVVVGPYGIYDFSASVSYGTGSEIVQYTCTAGTILDNGNGYFTFTAPGTPGDVAITAKVQGKVVQAGIIVHVQTPPSGVYVTLNPQRLVLGPNDSTYLDAKVYGAADATVNWSVVGGSSSGTITPVAGYTSVGNYTAPPTPGTYNVVATSSADPSKTATMQVEVLPRMNVVLVSGTTYQGDVAQFAATVEGVADQAVTWSASGGTITQTGTFTAPNSTATIWITVVSVADPRASACYPVFIPDVSVSLNYGQTILGGTTASLLATVTGTAATAVTWSIQSGGGSVVGAAPRTGSQQTATFYAPFPAGTTVVRATSVADPTKFATATYTMTTNTNLVLQKFTATPGKVNPGEAVELKGDFWNGTGVVQPGNLTLTQGVPLTVHPQGSTAYTLTVTSADGTKSASSTAGVGVVGPGHTEVTAQPTTYSSAYTSQRLRLDRNGQVLMIGGADPATESLVIERYNPASNTWSRLGQLQAGVPDNIQSVVLANGQVLIMVGRQEVNGGGYYRYFVGPNFLFDPETGTSSRLDGLGASARLEQPCVVPLKDDWILVAGGMGFPDQIDYCYFDCFIPKSRAFLINPMTQGVIEVGNLNQIQGRCSGGMLLDGRILIFGKNSLGHHAIEIYDPQTQLIALVGTSSTGTLLELVQAHFTVDQHLMSILGYGSKLPNEKLVVGPWNEIRTTLDPTTQYYRTVSAYIPPSVPPTQDSRKPFQAQTLPSGQSLVLANGEAGIFDSDASLVVTPAIGVQNLGFPVQFTASGPAASGVTWSASGGTISSTGEFTASQPGLYQITALSGSGVRAVAEIRIHLPISVRFTEPACALSDGVYHPTGSGMPYGADSYHIGWPLLLKAESLQHPNTAVTWSIQEGASAGTITAEGVFTGSTVGPVHIVATSVADPSKSAVLLLDVKPPISLSISPANAFVLVGGTINFTAVEVSGDNWADWTLNGNAIPGGRQCTLVAPMTSGVYTLQAKSHIDPSKVATTAVTVLAIQSMSISPSSITIGTQERVLFRCWAETPQGRIELSDSSSWSVSSAGVAGQFPGTGGDFLSGTTPGTYSVHATFGGTQATATLTIRPAADFQTSGFQQVVGEGCSITRLLNGQVLVAGGYSDSGALLKSAQVYNPVSKTFRALSAQLAKARGGHATTLLSNGKVLITGGSGDTTAEMFDPISETFTTLSGQMQCVRKDHRSLLMPNGMVLLGTGNDGFSGKSLEVFDPSREAFLSAGLLRGSSPSNSPSTTHGHDGALLLADGRVLFAGAMTIQSDGWWGPSAAELYDIRTGTTVWQGSMNLSHERFSLMQTTDGTVWSLGGTTNFQNNSEPTTQETFNPAGHAFSVSNPLLGVGTGPIELVDGSVWFWGYLSRHSGSDSGMRFDPNSGQCMPSRSPTAAVGWRHIGGTLLPNGNVLSFAINTFNHETSPALYLGDSTLGLVVFPRKITLLQGCAWPFLASSTGLGNPTFIWSIQEGAAGGTISAQGVYTAPFTPGTYHVVASSGGLQAVAIVEVVGGVDISVAPSLIQLLPSSSQGFSAHVIGASDGSVTWTASGGVITGTGIYTAPAIEGTYTLTATSVAYPDRSASATVVVKAGGSGGGMPAPIINTFATDTPAVATGQPANLSWTVTGASKLLLGTLDVTGRNGVAVRPTATTTYTLAAINAVGSTSSQAITISVSNEVVSVSITPKTHSLTASGQVQFGVNLSAPTTRLVWSCSGGTVTTGGLYTAPAAAGTFTVTVASVDDPSKSDTATVTVISASIQISPVSITLSPGQAHQFGYTLDGPPGAIIHWSASGGTISAIGLFTAPLQPGQYTVTVSSENPYLMSTGTVTVTACAVRIAPSEASLRSGQTQQFNATACGGGVTWSVLESGGGTVSQTGLYQAPSLPGTYTVLATSQADPQEFTKATVQVTAIEITISPSQVTMEVNEIMRFGASLNGGGWVWSATGGIIDDQGTYKAPLSPGVYTVTVQSLLDPSKSASAQVTVITGSSLRVDPNDFQARMGESVQLTVTGATSPLVLTVISESGNNVVGGTVNSSGLFTAGTVPGLFNITAGGGDALSQVRVISHHVLPKNALVGLGQQLQFTAEVYDGSSSVVWSILESGGGAINSNGLYTAPLQQGQYHVTAQTSNGNLADTAVNVGPPDGFVLKPEIDIQEAGTYRIQVRLKGANDHVTHSAFSGEFAVGVAQPEVAFSQNQLKHELGVDGPYNIDQVVLSQYVVDEFLEVDRKTALGVTGSYSITEADKPWISIGSILGVIGEDTNANGLIDVLKVQIQVDVICDGTYSLGGGLSSAEGGEIDSVQSDFQLTKGTNTITLSFDGRRIYASGKNGPYGIKGFTVAGPVMKSLDFRNAISGFSRDQFEH